MYHICTISDILRQGVDSLAQWLEHWISTPAVRVRIPSGTWDFFQTMQHFLVTNFHIRKKSHALILQFTHAHAISIWLLLMLITGLQAKHMLIMRN